MSGNNNPNAANARLIFSIKVPEAWKDGIPAENEKSFCASSERGEYALHRGSNGQFAVLLDGVPLTGYTIEDAVQAMGRANDYDGKLASHMCG